MASLTALCAAQRLRIADNRFGNWKAKRRTRYFLRIVLLLAGQRGHWDVLRWLRVEADPPCPWSAATEAKAKAHFGEAEVASWGGPAVVF